MAIIMTSVLDLKLVLEIKTLKATQLLCHIVILYSIYYNMSNMFGSNWSFMLKVRKRFLKLYLETMVATL